MPPDLPVPRRATVERIVRQLDRVALGDRVSLVLEITTDDVDLRVRDLASFLSVIDSGFGRSDAAGYLSYAHRPDDQLLISSIRPGSTKYEIAVLVLDYLQAWQTLVTYAVVISLPSLVSGRAVKNWADAYRAFEEGRAARSRRLEEDRLSRAQKGVIREVIGSDAMLSALPKRDRLRLARSVEHVLAMEDADAKRAARFSRDHVRSVALRLVEGPRDD